MNEWNYYFYGIINLSISEYLLILKEYYIYIFIIYKSENNRCGQKLIHGERLKKTR